MKFLLILALLVFSVNTANGQHPYYYSLNDENGLPSNEVYCVVQDELGFVWIGCEAGLYRYDGIVLKPYTNPKQNGRAISSLKIDHTGMLWCQNFAGQIYRVESDSLVIFKDVQNRIKSHPAFDVDEHQNVFIGLPEGILKITPEMEESLLFSDLFFATELHCLSNGELVVFGADKTFYRVDSENMTVLEAFESIYEPDVCWINKLDTSSFILVSNNNNKKYNLQSLKDLNQDYDSALSAIPNSEIWYTAYLLEQNNVWITTSNGVYAVSLETGKLLYHLFPQEKISNLFIDIEGNYWFTSLESGIHIMPNKDLVILNKYNSNLSDQNITSLYKLDENRLLIGTFSGQIFEYNPFTNNIMEWPRNANSRYRSVSSIISDGVNIFASRSNISQFYGSPVQEKFRVFDYLRDMQLKSDRLYFASTAGSGFIRMDQNYFAGEELNFHFFSNKSSKLVEYDSLSNKIWFAQSEGLSYLEGDSLCLFYDGNGKIYPLALHFFKDILWVGTLNNGLIGINDSRIQYRFNTTNFIRGNTVIGIAGFGNLLVAVSDECVNIIDIIHKKVEYVDIADGLNTKDINTITMDDDYIYLGSNKGLYLVPHNISKNLIRPSIVLESFLINGVSAKTTATIEANDFITVQFSASTIRGREQSGYKYRLRKDLDWKYVKGNSRRLEFNGLPPAAYDLEIYALNEDNLQSAESIKIAFNVSAPFYQKWWFYVSLVVLAFLLAAILYKIRINTIRKKALNKERLIQSQLRAIKAQMNPHFIFNSLNSIQDLILHEDIKNSYHYLNQFSLLMRKVLDSSDNDELSIAEEITFLELYLGLEKLRFGKEFTYEINVDKAIDKNRAMVPAMLLQPFIENAIKHGLLHKKSEKKLEITFMNGTGKDEIICLIIDNGVGRKRAQEIKNRAFQSHQSFALRAAEQRLDLINERPNIKIQLAIIDLEENNLPSGTRVELRIMRKVN